MTPFANGTSNSKPLPPPPPPRLGVSRSYGQVPHYQPPLPPHLPPKPVITDKARLSAIANSSSDNIQKPPIQNQRPILIHTSLQNRPSHIHTNGSINGNVINLSPPRYQQKVNTFSYQQNAIQNQNLSSSSLANEKSFADHFLANGQIRRMALDKAGENQKSNLDIMEKLTQFGGDPLTEENLVRNLESGLRKGVCWVSFFFLLFMLAAN